MADLEYTVTNQGIATTKTSRLVSGTIGVYTVKFTFNNVWDGLEKWATFDPIPGTPYKQPLDANGECTIPGEVMGGVYLRIGVFGLAEGQAYPTVWANKLAMEEGCFIEVPVSDWPEPSPVIEEILEELENKVDKPEDATPGNVAIIGSNSNIEDSGVSKDNLILAQQLDSSIRTEDNIPYISRPTGGGVEVGTREIDSIVGGSLNWNQLASIDPDDWGKSNASLTAEGNVLTLTPTTSSSSTFKGMYITVPVDHVIYITAKGITAPATNALYAGCYTGSGSFPGGSARFSVPVGAVDYPVAWLGKSISNRKRAGVYHTTSGTAGNSAYIDSLQIFDITEMFGVTMADALYTMEQAESGSGVAVLSKLLNRNMRLAYCPTSQMISAKPEAHIMKDADGSVVGNYPLGGVELRGVPVLDTDSIYYDGDTYTPDGTVTRRYNQIDLGEVTWVVTNVEDGVLRLTGGYGTGKGPKYQGKCFSDGYTYSKGSAYASMPDKSIRIGNSSAVPIFWIKDSDFIGKTASEAQALLVGKTAIYEIETPYTETSEPYDAVQICDPLGTEEYADSRTNRIPVGHVTQYPENQVAKLDGLPSNFSTLIAPTEVTYKATRAYTVGRLLIVNNILYKVTASIASGATLTVGTNITATTLDEVIASL